MHWAGCGQAKHYVRRKHVSIIYHYVLEKFAIEDIKLDKVQTTRTQAELLTKEAPPEIYQKAVNEV